jgi:hypothetical protein
MLFIGANWGKALPVYHYPNFVTLVGDRYGWRFAAGTGRLEWGEDAHG